MVRKRYMFVVLLFFLLLNTAHLLAAESITLERALKVGLENNHEIKNSELDIEKAFLDLKTAKRNYYPEISLKSTYTRLEEGPEIPVSFTLMPGNEFKMKYAEGSADNYNTQLSISQPIYLGGKIKSGIELAEEGIKLAELQSKKKTSDILYAIIQSYYNVLLAEERVDIEEDALRLVSEHKRVAEASYQAGLAIKTDLLQVEIEEGNSRQSLKDVQNKSLLAKKSLGNLIGLKMEEVDLLKPDLEPELELDFDELYQIALRGNQDLAMLAINQEIIETNLEMEKKSKLPSVMLIGNYGWQDDELSFEDGSWNINLAISSSLYDGGKAGLNKEKLKKDLAKIAESKEVLTDFLALEIEEKILSIKQNLQEIELQRLNLEKAAENLRLENLRYEAGMGTNIDVLNAQTIWKQGKILLLQAEYQYKLSLFELLQKTGTLAAYCEEVVGNE